MFVLNAYNIIHMYGIYKLYNRIKNPSKKPVIKSYTKYNIRKPLLKKY